MLAGCRVGIAKTGGAGSRKRDLYADSVKKTLIRIVSCNTLTLEMYLKGELLNGDTNMT